MTSAKILQMFFLQVAEIVHHHHHRCLNPQISIEYHWRHEILGRNLFFGFPADYTLVRFTQYLRQRNALRCGPLNSIFDAWSNLSSITFTYSPQLFIADDLRSTYSQYASKAPADEDLNLVYDVRGHIPRFGVVEPYWEIVPLKKRNFKALASCDELQMLFSEIMAWRAFWK